MTSVLQGNRFAPITPNDHSGSIWIPTLLCLVYSVLVVGVRAHLRRKVYGIDDYLILAATVRQCPPPPRNSWLIVIKLMHVGEAVAIIVGLRHGLGQTVSLLRLSDVSKASLVII